MTCEVIATGASRGNAVLVNGSILFDCGVVYKKLDRCRDHLSLVFLTHVHGDHFNPITIRRLHRARPTLRFVCCQNLLAELASRAGVSPDRIILVPTDGTSRTVPGPSFGEVVEITAFPLLHDVENVGYLVRLTGGEEAGSALYATDTHHIPISAPGLDYYLIEANYRQEDMERRLARKAEQGEFSYEGRVMQSHMSLERAICWLSENADPEKSKILFLHGHLEKEAESHGMD